jgi:hypothetical protein
MLVMSHFGTPIVLWMLVPTRRKEAFGWYVTCLQDVDMPQL